MAEAKSIDGKALAARLRARVGERVTALAAKGIARPGLATVLVGADPASQVYVDSKGKIAAELGMASFDHRLPPETTEQELLALIGRLNKDAGVNGILVQLPLPLQIDSARVLLAIDPAKDVDGFHPLNVGLLSSVAPGAPLDFPVPCTPLGCSMLLADTLGSLSGLNAVIVGRSNLAGRPVAQLLLRADCTVTMSHSRTRDLPALCRTADILVVAVGKPEFVRGDWIRPGATVIDVGINRVPAAGRQGYQAGGRRRLRRGDGGGGSCYASAGRRRPDDRRLPDVQHAAGGAPRRRTALRRALNLSDFRDIPATSASTL